MSSTRRVLAVSLAAVVALAFGVVLLALRYGRPLYYSDGTRGQAGASLSQASMLEFGEARILAELPGEIVGRLARLPDGRWIYGLQRAQGRVDLVAQDPSRPGLPPEALDALNSDGVDFSPAMGPGPSIYFVSDRAGGEGGLDLYRSEWREGSFGPVQSLRAGINTEDDESDPAPALSGPLAGSLVFVRQKPGEKHSRLLLGDLRGEGEALPLFPEWDAAAYEAMLRDPIFDVSGRSLFFVRRSRSGAHLLRTALHRDAFLEPWRLAGLDPDSSWRSPLPGPRGQSIDLLRPGQPALLYRSEAQERLVFWEGQRDLERFLLGGLLFSALLVILITLGGRWSSLDLLTRLLLLSLLIHGLVLLWMSRVDILTRNQEESGDEGTIQVEILSQEADAKSGDGRMEAEPVKDLIFEATQTPMRVEGPSSQLASADSTPSERSRDEVAEAEPDGMVFFEDVAGLSDAVEAPLPQSVDESVSGLVAGQERQPEPARLREARVEADSRTAGALMVRLPRIASLESSTKGKRRSLGGEHPRIQPADPSPANGLATIHDAVESKAPSSVDEELVGLESDTAVDEGLVPTAGRTEEVHAASRVASGLRVDVPDGRSLSSGRSGLEESWKDQRRALPSALLSSSGMAPTPVEAQMRDQIEPSRGDPVPPPSPKPMGTRALVPESQSLLASGSVPPLRPRQADLPGMGQSLKRQAVLLSRIGATPPPRTSLVRASRARRRIDASHHGAKPDVFRNRFGTARIAALRRYGGTQKTEAAVRSGLAYLARVQREDGSWGYKAVLDDKYGETFVGKTGLCLLAFLGAGHVPGKQKVHSPVARKAMEFLLYVQDEETGHFGLTSAYSHGISTYALAECYALTKDKKLKAPLEAAVLWILSQQNRSRDWRHDGGWGYYSPTLESEDGYARTSVSSWQVMALLSARKAGLEVPEPALARARSFFANSYDRRRGYYLYNREPGRLRSRWRTLPASTPASVFSLLLLGEELDTDRVQGGLQFTLARRPRDYRWRGNDAFVREAAGNIYFWYYGTLASFLAGGDTWKQWNQSLVTVLPQAQLADGSFKPMGPYASYAGDDRRDRSYSTAMCVLSLEIYYRYFTPLLQGRR